MTSDFDWLPEDFDWLPDGSLCLVSLKQDRYARISGDLKNQAVNDRRSPTERDIGRVTYSPFLRRLGGVAQIVSPTLKHATIHNRLTHSQKVSLLAKEIASDLLRRAREDDQTVLLDRILQLGGIDISACAAAGLAHDIGHAPFGHSTEKTFDNWLRDIGDPDGFEGNAQTIRVAALLDSSPGGNFGLELTHVTLSALMKYPHGRSGGKKFSVYSDPPEILQRARTAIPVSDSIGPLRDSIRQSIEANIVDLSDDITYATHDLQDFIQAGILNVSPVIEQLQVAALTLKDYRIEDLTQDRGHSPIVSKAIELNTLNPEDFPASAFSRAIAATTAILKRIRDGEPGFDLDVEDGHQLLQQIFSAFIGSVVNTIEVYPRALWKNGPLVRPSIHMWLVIQLMKLISQRYIIESSTISIHEQAHKSVIAALLDALIPWIVNASSRYELPTRLHIYLIEQGRPDADSPAMRRAVVDYLCSLTDDQCDDLRRKLTGLSLPSIETSY